MMPVMFLDRVNFLLQTPNYFGLPIILNHISRVQGAHVVPSHHLHLVQYPEYW